MGLGLGLGSAAVLMSW